MKITGAHPRLRRVCDETEYWLSTANTPGLAVALIEDDLPPQVFCFGSIDIDGSKRVTESTIFPAASLSKQAFLYAVLKTVEADKLDIDRPLAEYMDKPYDVDDPDLDLITARHVLTHTTGWLNWPQKDKPIPRSRPPGEQWGYSGLAYVYLQETMEAIWDEPAVNYTDRLVLDPLRMRHSSFVWRDEYSETAVTGHESSGSACEAWQPDAVNAAASLHTTAGEYGLLLRAYLDPEMQRRHPDVYGRQIEIKPRVGWSLGWGTADDVLWQWGHDQGIKAFTAIDPARDLGIVVLSNGARGQRISREWVNAWLETDLPAFYFRSVDL